MARIRNQIAPHSCAPNSIDRKKDNQQVAAVRGVTLHLSRRLRRFHKVDWADRRLVARRFARNPALGRQNQNAPVVVDAGSSVIPNQSVLGGWHTGDSLKTLCLETVSEHRNVDALRLNLSRRGCPGELGYSLSEFHIAATRGHP